MRNIKITLEYDGTEFNGWQWQPEGRTIERTLREAIQSLLQESPKLIAAGRTDAGVHALGQVANFKTNSTLENTSIRLGLNSFLPPDIVVVDVSEVDHQFHARYDAVNRRYRYLISKRLRAVARGFSWYCKHDLDSEAVQHAMKFFLGRHNFRSFCRGKDGEHYLSNVEQVEWRENEDYWFFEICANRFLHHMVRSILGTLVEVGRGKIQPDAVKQILEAQDRDQAGFTAPAQGLTLLEVSYAK